LGNQRR